uniref:Uncharacterized protein n=1 Tax=Haptolina brevifila TaxID=156173 RepID=A0A7S2NLM5_9EUKA|mmetsp:Transcript_81656/g.162476  ORF Transcript_81656/g.162476 Transcript_81656/m.162476 type:complete len:104 (+) Transcript_81656:709-1020(+)
MEAAARATYGTKSSKSKSIEAVSRTCELRRISLPLVIGVSTGGLVGVCIFHLHQDTLRWLQDCRCHWPKAESRNEEGVFQALIRLAFSLTDIFGAAVAAVLLL